MEQAVFERFYPLTYPGYYTKELEKYSSLCYEHCRIDVSRFRGERIGIQASLNGDDACILLTDEGGKILERWEEAPSEFLIPENALFLYLSNHYATNPDFFLNVPREKCKKQNGFLFYEDFTRPEEQDGNDFLEKPSSDSFSDEGLYLPTGIENAVVLHKTTALDDWCLTAEVIAPEGDEVICLGTRITQDRPCRHASLCCVDLALGEIRLYRGGMGCEMPEEVLQCAPLSDVITKGEFTIRLERVNSAIRACATNPDTGKEVCVMQDVMQQEAPPSSIAGACRAGKMFDSPQVFALAGAPLIRRMYGAAKVFPKAIFFGDSITQGAHNMPENGWAQRCAREIGNSLTSGRGSGDIWSCLNQVRTMLPTLRPKVMVISIGTNNRDETVSVKTVGKLYEKFIHMAEYHGVILILNHITVCHRPHVLETNKAIHSLKVMGSRFDLATAEKNVEGGEQVLQYYVTDHIHLNGEGNQKLYDYFMHDFPWLRNL